MKIIVLMMMVLSNKAMAAEYAIDCSSIPNYERKVNCVWKRSVPDNADLRKIYLMNVSLEDACIEFFRLKNNIAKQSAEDSIAMHRYAYNVNEYIKNYVNPRLKDMEYLALRYPGIENTKLEVAGCSYAAGFVR